MASMDATSETDLMSESDTSSVEGSSGQLLSRAALVNSCDALNRRVESLIQERRVLKVELETLRLKLKSMQQENQDLRRNSVDIHARAEQEEEFISNTLMKKIHCLKKEKEQLATSYEQEEEFLTNDLSRKLFQLRKEKVDLEEHLEKEQEQQVAKLHRHIDKLEAEVAEKQIALEQLRQDKVQLENSLEQEQEALVNRLWKRMEKLELEKRGLQSRFDALNNVNNIATSGSSTATITASTTTAKSDSSNMLPPSTVAPLRQPPSQDPVVMSMHIGNLKTEVLRLKRQLALGQTAHQERMSAFVEEERQMQEENLRLRKKLQMEIERREALCRHLSESESSLEMDDERQFNEQHRHRTISSPIPRPISPAVHVPPGAYSPLALSYTNCNTLASYRDRACCKECGQVLPFPLPSPTSSNNASKSGSVSGQSTRLSGTRN